MTGPTSAGVQVIDRSSARVHSLEDAVDAVLAVLGVVAVLLLAVYAHATTTGVAQDVQGIDVVLGRVLVVPVAVLGGVVAVLAPVGVLLDLATRGSARRVLEAVVAGLVGAGLAWSLARGVQAVGSPALVSGLSVSGAVSVPVEWALLMGLLTVAGPRSVRRPVAWAQNALAVVIGVQLVAGRVSLPGVAVALLLGRAAGCVVRLLAGVPTARAYGAELAGGLHRVGVDAVLLTRLPGDGPREYAAVTADGPRHVRVLDGDRQVLGTLVRLWRSVRLRGIEGRAYLSLRQAAERAALLSHAARVAGVRTPLLLAVGQAQDSMLLVSEPVEAVALAAGSGEAVTDDATLAHARSAGVVPADETLADAWAQLLAAHAAGLAHRSLSAEAVRVDAEGRAWLVSWDDGDLAVSDLTRRIDLAQMLALQGLAVGAPRALAVARAALPAADLAALVPLLQPVIMPRSTREGLRADRELLAALRDGLATELGDAELEPVRLTRFGWGTLATVVLPVVAVTVVLTKINVTQVLQAVEASDWRWSLVAFGLGLLTFVGAAAAFAAFSPVRIRLRTWVLVQMAAAFLSIAAPAQIGIGALNLRAMVRKGAQTSIALATVALVQVAQFVVTLSVVIVLSVVSGSDAAAALLPSGRGLWLAASAVVLVAAALLVPPVRRWATAKVLPVLQQTWPRLIEVLGRPGRVAAALGGGTVLTLSWILAFAASLQAFDVHLSLVQVAVIYFAGNLAGSAVPTPGGIGGIELALTGLLAAAGVNAGVAWSAVMLFRLATYWLQIPLGWVAMRVLRRADAV